LILEFDERLSGVYMMIGFALLMAFLVVSRFAVQRALKPNSYPYSYPLDPKTKFLSLVPTPGEIAPQYQTTVISSDDVAATAALKGSHEQGAPACSS
jgi:hypothetical protein